MMYTLVVSSVFNRAVDFVPDEVYVAKGILIASNHSEEISQSLMASLKRGVTYLNNEGAHSQAEKRALYTVVNPREIMKVKRIANEMGEKAFAPIINVHEAISGGFTYAKPGKQRRFKLKQ